MRKLLLVLAGVAVFFCYLDYQEKKEFQELKSLKLDEQYAIRECPPFQEDLSETSTLMRTVNFGPYSLELNNDFLQIDAVHHHKKGGEHTRNGKVETYKADRSYIQIHTLAPNMIPHFLMSRKHHNLRDKGYLYHVGIELFWSGDNSFKPWPSKPIVNKIIADNIGPYFQRVADYTANELVLIKSNEKPFLFPGRIRCYGTCYINLEYRENIWIRYEYNSENLQCWKEIHNKVIHFLDTHISHTQ